MSWSRFAPYLLETPRYLSIVLTAEERMAIEDVVFDRLGIASLQDWQGPNAELFTIDSPLAEFTREQLGRDPSRLLEISGVIPFDWNPGGSIKTSDVDAHMGELPHRVPGRGPFRYFGADDSVPPYLWTSFESPGLQLGGIVEEVAWAAWTTDFGERMASLPLRTLGV